MARINKTLVLAEATEAARRINVVIEDPAVIKSAKQAHRDIVQAVRSCNALTGEVRSAWAGSV